MDLPAGNGFYDEFSLVNGSGQLQNADSLPTASLVKNGAVDGAVTVTVANVSNPGLYKVSCTLGAYVAGDIVYVRATGAVDGVTFWWKSESAAIK